MSNYGDATRPLHGRRILVTGGATGIGAAGVEVLTDAGAHVVATYHQTQPRETAAVSWLQCDVRDSAAVDAMVDDAVRILGGLDVLLHAAGLWQAGIPDQITGDNIDFLVDTNLKATIFTNQAAYNVMRENGGRIINFGSGEAVMGSPLSAFYAATKGVVQGVDAFHREGVGGRQHHRGGSRTRDGKLRAPTGCALSLDQKWPR